MNLALFDFDGTITHREMLPAFVRFAVPPARLRVWSWLLAPWVIGYRLGWVSGVSIRAMIARAGFRGMREADYRAAGERFARDALPPTGSTAIRRRSWTQPWYLPMRIYRTAPPS